MSSPARASVQQEGVGAGAGRMSWVGSGGSEEWRGAPSVRVCVCGAVCACMYSKGSYAVRGQVHDGTERQSSAAVSAQQAAVKRYHVLQEWLPCGHRRLWSSMAAGDESSAVAVSARGERFRARRGIHRVAARARTALFCRDSVWYCVRWRERCVLVCREVCLPPVEVVAPAARRERECGGVVWWVGVAIPHVCGTEAAKRVVARYFATTLRQPSAYDTELRSTTARVAAQ